MSTGHLLADSAASRRRLERANRVVVSRTITTPFAQAGSILDVRRKLKSEQPISTAAIPPSQADISSNVSRYSPGTG